MFFQSLLDRNKWRMILNLKQLNKKNVEYHHFKMKTLRNALALVTPNCFFCSLDLEDAYYSVHVNKLSQEFFKSFSGKASITHLLHFQVDLTFAPDYSENC